MEYHLAAAIEEIERASGKLMPEAITTGVSAAGASFAATKASVA